MRYGHEELSKHHPELAKAFETVMGKNHKLALRLKYLYYPHYLTGKRADKTLKLERIIKEVQDAGYKIEIKVHDPSVQTV